MLFWISTSWATFGLVANREGVIVLAAPIAGWSYGKTWRTVLDFYVSRDNAQVFWQVRGGSGRWYDYSKMLPLAAKLEGSMYGA